MAAAVAALLLGGGLAAPPAGAVITCDDATGPEVFPVADLEDGMTGTGYTAVDGRTPQAFDVEILGVLRDGIAPGIDFILIKVSGPLIDDPETGTGGIAFGFSGSPVYIDGKLVGAIAYGFFGDASIGGVTPAEAMVQIFDYPFDPATGTVSPGGKLDITPAVALPYRLRRAASEASGEPASSFLTGAERLTVPVAVSGLNDRALSHFQRALDQKQWGVALYRAGSVSAPTAGQPASDPLAPGEPFAAVLSYGDLTFAGIGTTTAVCGDFALAFGHPFFFQGPSAFGMNAADVRVVVRDPFFGGFKLAEVAETHGIVDQDRLAAIRGIEGLLPVATPITASAFNPDLNKSRAGETDVVLQDYLPFLAAYHLLLTQDVAFDRIGDGSVDLFWTIAGTRESGEPYTVSRHDMYYSEFDASIVSIFDLEGALYQILFNEFEDVTVDSVDADATITQEELRETITRVQSSSSVQPLLRKRSTIVAQRGSLIHLRVFLEDPDGVTRSIDLSLRVPEESRGRGKLTVAGGRQNECFYCYYYYYGGEEGDGPESFDDIIAEIEGDEHAFDLVASLFPNRETGRTKILPQDRIVLGTFEILVRTVP